MSISEITSNPAITNGIHPAGTLTFSDLALPAGILSCLEEVGYTIPSPIQLKSIPVILKGRDIIGQAQTGTGKTAAFALPILSKLDMKSKSTQVLVLAPTRELCIQVCESFKKYASHLKGVKIISIYGGQNYQTQFRSLDQNPQVVVGTPGRIMDHLRRGSLDISNLTTMVLDEADEMLRMGFAEDVEWILEKTPKAKQTILFSATMPPQIRKLANTYLNKPEEITINSKTETTKTIHQQYWIVQDVHKLDGLTRILESIKYDAVLVFVKTKNQTTELAERLKDRGFIAVALNGDIAQKQREQTISQLKRGQINILIATDVAARGLDIDRIDYVINYDAPYDAETYIHRIGRTGRAGNKGTAILFVSPRERRTLEQIEHHTRQKIERFELPTSKKINERRIQDLFSNLDKASESSLKNETLHSKYKEVLTRYANEKGIELSEVSSLLAQLLFDEKPLFLKEKVESKEPSIEFDQYSPGRKRNSRDRRPYRDRGRSFTTQTKRKPSGRSRQNPRHN
jgi:ATP-dependent RNA helicase DeaD